MNLLKRRAPAEPGVIGSARCGRRVSELLPKIKKGDIVVVDEIDLTRADAEALVARHASAVIDLTTASSGRYPNLGPQVLINAGIPLVDHVGADLVTRIRDGERLRISGGEVFRGSELIASGTEQSYSTINSSLAQGQAGMSARLDALVAETSELLRQKPVALEPSPTLATDLADAPILLIGSGPLAGRSLKSLRDWARRVQPIVVVVGANANVANAAGIKPHVVIAEPDAIEEKVLSHAVEVVVASPPTVDPDPHGILERLGIVPTLVTASRTDEDLALELIEDGRPSVIVTTGCDLSVLALLDRGAGQGARALMGQMRAAGRLIDADAMGELEAPRSSWWPGVLIALTAAVAVAVALVATPAGTSLVDHVRSWFGG